MNLTAADQRQLDENGYVVIENFFAPDLVAQLRERVERLFAEEGDAAGSEFKKEPGCLRLANLSDKGEVFRSLLAMPRLWECVGHVLGPDFKLSSFNARSVLPNGTAAQPLHADMGAIADERGYWVCNTVWMLDDFTPQNGTLRIVPGSHRWKRLPQESLADPLADHSEQVLVTGRAGTVVVVNAHAWHAGTANRTASARTALHIFFCRRDKPQQQYQKRLVRPEVQQALSPQLRHLLALDDPLNDQISAEVAVRSGFLK